MHSTDDDPDAPATLERGPRRRSFRWQVTLVFGALVSLTAVLLSYAGGEVLKNRVRERTEQSLNVVTLNVARTVASELFNGSNEVQKMAGLDVLWAHGLGTPDVSQMLALNQANSPYMSWAGVADLQGVVRSATGNVLLGQNVGQRPWFIAGLKSHLVGDVHPAKLLAQYLPAQANGEPVRFVDFAAPLKLKGQTVGVLGIHGSVDWLHKLIDKLLPSDALARQMEVFVFDKGGELVFGPDGRLAPYVAIGQKMPMPVPAEQLALAKTPVVAVMPWADGHDYLTSVFHVQAINPVSDLGWQVATREPVDLAFAAVRTATWQALGIGLATALLASLLAWWVAGRVSRHLSSIAQAARDVEAGVSGAQIPLLHSSTELQSLSTSLNRMTQRLIDAKFEVETEVQQRTAELQVANAALDQLAQTDPLTGLLNRRGFDILAKAALALARRSGRPLTVMMMDIDHFKAVNDEHGHDAGDYVLVSLARLVKERLREADVVGRVGGEEFVALLPDTDLEGAVVLAEILREAVAALHLPCGPVTVSAGVALLGSSTTDMADLLHQADMALYRAKGSGRNRVCT